MIRTPSVQSVLSGLQFASTAGENAVAVDCLLDRPTDAVYASALFFLFLPATAALLLAVGWKVQCYVVQDRTSFTPKFIMSCVVVFCLIHSSVARSAMLLLVCKSRGLDRTPYLVRYLRDREIER